ncbi:MAG: MerR family transcriptional regulator [Planctomycetes bacterium]|nr:MerR family transcriptional regulator [Planctomycetota bacterium]
MSENRKYKIGAISKLLGIPIQTLHYYEQCGFVSPQKDSSSKYRYYDAWDVNYLLDGKQLRSYDFSNAEIEEMINCSSVEDIQAKFDQQERRLVDRMYHYQAVLDELNAEKKRLAAFRDDLGKFSETKSPQLYFNPYRLKNSYRSSTDREDIPRIDNWLSHMPFIKATFKITRESIDRKGSADFDYWWGFSVPPKRAKEMNIPTHDAEYMASQLCQYTVFTAHSQNTFIPSVYEQVFTPLWRRGFEISDAPVGRLIVRAHEEGEYTRYFEIWVPVAN